MKLLLTILLLLNFSLSCYSQATIEPRKELLPNFTPPSPEAYSMSKYGDIEIDDYNGKVNLDIPIYNLKAGMLNLPISLKYYGAGVKVRDLPTQVGMNWNLNAGGVITREIRDWPDEYNSNRMNLTASEITNLNALDCTNAAANFLTFIGDSNNYDTETDIFNFNFSGYSGSFFLDNNLNPVIIKNEDELKIVIVGNLHTNKEIIITVPDGVKYYFGGENATETTQGRNVVSPSGFIIPNGGGITSFFLKQIEHPINGKILFEYETIEQLKIWLSTTHTTNELDQNNLNMNNPTCPSMNNTRSISVFENSILDGKFISRIHDVNNDTEIIFQRSSVLKLFAIKPLVGIIIKKNNVDFTSVNFDYLGLENLETTKRFFLKEINFNYSAPVNNSLKEKYFFEYNDPDALPLRTSTKIDLLGYFNNKNNTDLFPCLENQNILTCPNRESNFVFSSKGVLKKVIYPTKGYTLFEYESQPIKKGVFELVGGSVLKNIMHGAGDDCPVDEPCTRLYNEFPQNYIDENGVSQTIFSMPILYTQTVEITLNANTFDNIPNRFATFKITIKNLTDNTEYSRQTVHNLSFNYEFIKDKNYKIEIFLIELKNNYPEYSASGSFAFKLLTGYEAVEGSGVRVKRTKDFADSNTPSLIKRYYYKSFDKINDINADLFESRPNISNNGSLAVCPPHGGFGGLNVEYGSVIFKSISSNYDILDFSSNKFFRDYSKVTISYGDDNFKLGGIEKTYANTQGGEMYRIEPLSNNRYYSEIPFSFPKPPDNQIPLSGMLLKEKIFKTINNTVYKVKEVNHYYDYNLISRRANVMSFKIFDSGIMSICNLNSYESNVVLSDRYIGGYYNNSYSFNKSKVETIDYFDLLPASLVPQEDDGLGGTVYPSQATIEAPYKKIITTQNYTYGSLRGLPTEITSTTSENNSVVKTVNTYVDTATSLTGIPANQNSMYTSLIGKNIISSPVQTQTFRNNSLLSTQRTLYQNVSVANEQNVLPEKIQTSKGNQDLENRATFYNYDANFNPVVFSLEGGPKIRYIFNTKGLVVAKIENYTGTQTTFPLVEGNIDNAECALQNQNPNAVVTVFTYNLITNQIVQITDSRCNNSFYFYDALHRLQYIKDHQGNILEEYNNNYRPQN